MSANPIEIASILDRFRREHPGGDIEALRAWAVTQEGLRENPDLIERLVQALRDEAVFKGLMPRRDSPSEERSLYTRPGHEPRAVSADSSHTGPHTGRRIGRFVLQELLGQGGMGQVWAAEDTDLRRRVALKLVLPSRVDEKALELFAREARAGGRLHHPGIVTTLAHGNDDGLSWIAQELVEGCCTLKDSVNELRAADRVPEDYYSSVADLIARLADALQAAHDAGVIHRDVKPANILVTPDDQPKLTDFGLARVSDDSMLSLTGEFAGTWAYMSPEQVTAKRMGLDHRTDVFSLGVVLYELATLRRPFEGDTTHQIATRIIAQDPPLATSVRSQCPMEIAVICAKAMEKDPGRRYSTMGEFAADLRRHLANEPILARPPSPMARAIKWVQRNPAVSSAALVGVLALLVVSVLLAHNVETQKELTASNRSLEKQTDIAEANAREARAAEARAQANAMEARSAEAIAEGEREKAAAALAAERERAEELDKVATFQAQQLGGIRAASMGEELRQGMREGLGRLNERKGEPLEKLEAELASFDELVAEIDMTGLALKALEAQVLLPAIETIDRNFEELPLVRARLLQSVAITATGLGLLDLARGPQEEALQLRRDQLGDGHKDTLASIESSAYLAQTQGRLEAAGALYREALDANQDAFGDGDYRTAELLRDIGAVLQQQGRLQEAEGLLRQALETTRRTMGDESPATISSLNSLGVLLGTRGKYAESEPYLRESLETSRRVLGDEDPQTLTYVGNMGALLRSLGRFEEAEPYHRECLEGRRRVLGDEHTQTLDAINSMGYFFAIQQRFDEAEPFHREALETSRRVYGDSHPATLGALNDMGALLATRGNLEEAETIFLEVIEIKKAVSGPSSPEILPTMNNMGHLLVQQGKHAEAEPYFRDALNIRRQLLGDENPETLVSISNMGSLLQRQGKLEEAEAHFREAYLARRRILGDEHPLVLAQTRGLIRVLVEQAKAEEARELLRDFLDTSDLPADHTTRLAVSEMLDELSSPEEGAGDGGGD